MILLLSIVTGLLFSFGVFLMLRRSLVKLIIGFILFSNAANLSVFLSGNPKEAAPPIIDEAALANSAMVSDPLPQALILTAIVISFGFLAFSIVLIYKVYRTVQSEDLNSMRTVEKV